MDERHTLKPGESFVEVLNEIKQANLRADFILDRNGLERASGFITEITAQASTPFVILSTGEKIIINEIAGVNGIFRDDFSTC